MDKQSLIDLQCEFSVDWIGKADEQHSLSHGSAIDRYYVRIYEADGRVPMRVHEWTAVECEDEVGVGVDLRQPEEVLYLLTADGAVIGVERLAVDRANSVFAYQGTVLKSFRAPVRISVTADSNLYGCALEQCRFVSNLVNGRLEISDIVGVGSYRHGTCPIQVVWRASTFGRVFRKMLVGI